MRQCLVKALQLKCICIQIGVTAFFQLPLAQNRHAATSTTAESAAGALSDCRKALSWKGIGGKREGAEGKVTGHRLIVALSENRRGWM